MRVVFFFFFQAEDGIRDYKVTGVQTCALPISGQHGDDGGGGHGAAAPSAERARRCQRAPPCAAGHAAAIHALETAAAVAQRRTGRVNVAIYCAKSSTKHANYAKLSPIRIYSVFLTRTTGLETI